MQVDARKPRTKIDGLLDDQLAYLADFKKFRLRNDVAVSFDEMSKDMLAAYAGRSNPDPKDSIGVASTYRSADEDARAWEKAFKKHFARTAKARQETGDELGDKALNIMFHTINGKKAPAGFSGHTHGIAADMTTTQFGTVWTVNSDYDHQIGWQGTWLFGWLVENAAKYDFYQLKSETWHWEYHDKEPAKGDQCWGGSVPIKSRPVPKPR